MKKISTLLMASLLVTGAAFSQSQRLVLVEEFTQASCPPCAVQNPAFNTLLNANTTKVVAIKYQVWWPGFDPMYNQNPTDVDPRVAYYGVTGVPNIRVDGNASQGAPSSLTQTSINNRYAIPSEFTVALSHSFNASYSTIDVNCVITATQAITGTLKARIGIIERDIYFTAAPGTNGELHFEGVMKKMLPDAEGTALPTTWSAGDTQTLTFSVPVPSYTYDLNQLAVVAFIQDDAGKSVKQAGFSAPIGGIATTNDAGISALTGLTFLNCTGTFNPSVTIKNYSTTAPLTSCNINYAVDGGTPTTIAWTGSIATNGTLVYALPTLNLTNGLHTINFYTSDPNGGIDYKPINNSRLQTVDVIVTSAPAPIVEDFQSTTFPSANWAINNPNTDDSFERFVGYGGFAVGATEASSFINIYNIPAGRFDEMYLPGVSLVSNNSASLTFDVAYAQYQTENDKLEVMVSTNCGTAWTTIFTKQGATLSTAPATTANFAPNATQWRTENVSLSSYLGQNIIMKFKATSAYGNNMWIDNINLNGTTGIALAEFESAINVYPNPAKDVLNISAKFTDIKDLNITLVDITGRTIATLNATGNEFTKTIDLANIAAGTYLLKVQSENSSFVKKVTVE